MSDFLFRGTLSELDPEINEITQIEAERQYRRLILIPSESAAPLAVREALSSAFNNIYAEGYPDEASRWMSDQEILDHETRLAHYRRYSDPRYYKGVEYADTIEALARRRCAQTFAANGFSADELYVNVQALSGAPANNAVYHALVKPGDTVLGMDLLHGGHLSHGSPVNRSGKYYNIVHYTIDPETERIDYDSVADLARKHKPKMIISGYSSYPWQADWGKFREIADEVGAYLLADIAHVAGLVAGGAYPSPVGFAHVITFTTHKTLCGPRGACILTTDPTLSRKIDRAVFPGEQGGPHISTMVALGLTFKLAQTQEFSRLQHQIVANSVAFTKRFMDRGFRIPFGGTDTHLMNLDCRTIQGSDGAVLSGDQAARILDLAGIVVNRNTIPGDSSALHPSGIRMGTPWITQRGFKEEECNQLSDIIADLLLDVKPYRMPFADPRETRSKIDFHILHDIQNRVRDLALSVGIDFDPPVHGYPHFYYIDDKPQLADGPVTLEIKGEPVRQFINFVVSTDAGMLSEGERQITILHTPKGQIEANLTCVSPLDFHLTLTREDAMVIAAWLRDLSDGFIAFDPQDIFKKIPGPVTVKETRPVEISRLKAPSSESHKPFFIGLEDHGGEALPEFEFHVTDETLKRTTLFETHKAAGAKMIPFAGWEMPVWYSSVKEEHLAVRESAGLFDVSHMGVFQAEGADGMVFLDCVCANDISALEIGGSLYTHFLDPEANVIDDLLVYRRTKDKYLLVVNAANAPKDWAWLLAVKSGSVCVDNLRPSSKAYGRNVVLRDLHHPTAGGDRLVDIALQGLHSLEILLALGSDPSTEKQIRRLERTHLGEFSLGGLDLVVSRTGYTGEKTGFELFVHPDNAVQLWEMLMSSGKRNGLKPCGLGSRDSLRTEAGLPLYGHELGGQLNLGVAEAGFGKYIKVYKPWFVGRKASLKKEITRGTIVVRFRFNEGSVRMAHHGDPVLDPRGRVIGKVTSCAIDRFSTLTGQAVVPVQYATEGTLLYILQGGIQKVETTSGNFQPGDRLTLPTAATVLRRFPRL